MTETAETTVDPVLERVKTGVEAFDDLVMGGLPRGRTTIVGRRMVTPSMKPRRE